MVRGEEKLQNNTYNGEHLVTVNKKNYERENYWVKFHKIKKKL